MSFLKTLFAGIKKTASDSGNLVYLFFLKS